MARLTLLVAALAPFTFVAAQEQSQSEIAPALPAETAGGTCGGCYLVADVAGIVFGGVQTITDTEIQSVGRTPNNTVVTTITKLSSGSATATVGQLTFSPDATDGPQPTAPAINFNDLNSTIIVNGATLTSPTQYEVFTAFSVTSFTKDESGSCVAVPGSASTLSSASKYVVTAEADDAFLLGLQSSFIDGLGLSCSAGGGNVASTIQSMIERTTETSTTQGIIRPTPVAASVASSSTASATSIAAPLSTAPIPGTGTGVSTAISSTTVIFGNATLGLPTGTGTFTYAPIATGAASSLGARWLGAAAVACGLGAFFL